MKTYKLILPLIAATTLVLGLASCDKSETATPATNDANKAADAVKAETAKAADAVKTEAPKVVDAAKAETAKVADAAKVDAAKTETANAADNGSIQGLIDKARSLVTDGKYSDATSVLQQLAGKSLSSDQQKIVDGLKEQIQKALASKATENAAGAAGNLLKK